MSSGCGDVLSLADLQTTKKHQIFEAEVITGRSGGVAGGAAIDYATNPVTGQTQKTLPAVLRDAGIQIAPFDFSTGGTLGVGDAGKAVLWPTPSGDGNYYLWKGDLPKTIPAASSPTSTGGVSLTAWTPISSGNAFDLVAFDGTRYTNRGNFATGVTLTKNTDVVKELSTGWFYKYLGAFPHVVAEGESLDSNWQALGTITGYAYNHVLNWKTESVTDEQALTGAFKTGLEVDITGADLTTTTDYTCPVGSRGLYGRGTITLGNHFRLPTFTFPTLTTFTASASASHSEVYLDGVDRTGQYVVIDNGYPFCIDLAEDPSTPADSIDSIALTRNLNAYQSQFIQVTEIIGHTADNKAILAQPLVTNQVAGVAKFGFPTGNLTQFRIRDGVTMKSSGNVMRRLMIFSQIKPEVVGCTFHNVHVEFRYYCYSARFERNRLTGNVAESMVSFATSSSVCSIKDNVMSTLGLNDATIGVYRQVCYANVVGNIVTDPLISTAYAPDHWGIMFHSMVYHSLMAGNTVTARTGVCAQFFCDEVLIEGNKVFSFQLTSVYNQHVAYVGNDFSYIADFTIQGNQRFVSKSNRYNIRGGSQVNNLTIIAGTKPFGFAGFKTINSQQHEFTADNIGATTGNTFVNPKTLMADPTTAGSNAVFPVNNTHMTGMTAGIFQYDSRVASIKVTDCYFYNLNYGINLYKNNPATSVTNLQVSGSTFETDVGICLRGTEATHFFDGLVDTSSFLGSIGIINANTNGYAVINCAFRSVGMSAILVASNLAQVLGITMNTGCTFKGNQLTGMKWYDFNGYAASYDTTVTYSKASLLPKGYWWYEPKEDLGAAANIPYEYSVGATSSGGVILRKAVTVTQIV